MKEMENFCRTKKNMFLLNIAKEKRTKLDSKTKKVIAVGY